MGDPSQNLAGVWSRRTASSNSPNLSSDRSEKTKWRFTLSGQPFFWGAGLIKDGAFATLTTEPGEDIVPYQDRQIVVLRPEDGAA